MTDGHCFISYSNGDADDFGPELATQLEGGNPYIETWYDKRDIPGGSTWDEVVHDAIKDSKCLIYVLSKDSANENSICAEEWDLALRYKKPILIIKLEKDIELPFRLGKRQWIDFSNNRKAGIAQLRLAIKGLDSIDGQLRILRDRLADAKRDLVRAKNEIDKKRIQSEIDQINVEIKTAEVVKKNPDKASKQTRKSINEGLEQDRQPLNIQRVDNPTKFINPPPGSIPDYFEGRFVETQEIADFIKSDHQKLLTIIGRAGSGKTALACRVLQNLEHGHFPNDLGELEVGGIVYLSEISNYNINVANIFSGLLTLIDKGSAKRIEQLYREPKVSIENKIQILLENLPQKPTILLLDNFEDLINPNDEHLRDQELEKAIIKILDASGHFLKLIITTRVPPRDINLSNPASQDYLHLEDGLPSLMQKMSFVKWTKTEQQGYEMRMMNY